MFETRDPTNSDINYPLKKQWFNTTNHNFWILAGFTTTSGQLQATWEQFATSIEGVEEYAVLVGATGSTIASITPDASTTKVLVSGGASADPSWQDIADGAIDLGTFGSTPNTAGASLSGSTLTMQPADATNPGGVSTGAQSFAGEKTFVAAPILPLTGVLVGEGASAVSDVTPVIDGVMISDHAAGVPSFLSNGTAGYVLTAQSGAPPAWSAGSVASLTVNVQTFTSNGTYTPTSGMVWCKIEGCGGGAGGGACDSGPGGSVTASVGGGGGAGEYGFIWASAATIGASKSITIGSGGAGGTAPSGNGASGGATVVNTIITLNGGSGGLGGDDTSTGGAVVSAGGVGGTAGSGGDFKTNGNPGFPGQYVYAVLLSGAVGGQGGSSPYGTAGAAATISLNISGAGVTTSGQTSPSGYGGGGGGAVNISTSTSQPAAADGGAGSLGVIIITEYIKA